MERDRSRRSLAFELGVGKILAQLGLGPGVSSTQMLTIAYDRVYNNVLTKKIEFSDFAREHVPAGENYRSALSPSRYSLRNLATFGAITTRQ
jgi:hypothetical protein